MNAEYMKRMTSPQGIYNRSFFQCKEDDCGFVFTNLGQESNVMDVETCPACGEYSIDYAPTEAREQFINKFFSHVKGLKDMIKEGAGE